MKNLYLKLMYVVMAILAVVLTLPYIFSYRELDSVDEIVNSSRFSFEENINSISVNVNQSINSGVILYPGGLVSPRAYIPFCYEMANQGYSCIISKMPFNLAIFGVNRAEKIIESNNQISNWYVGGHSLGGPMISRFVDKYNGDNIKGIFFLASYTDIDLRNKNITCVSIIGSEDNILDREVYEKSKSNFPKDCKEVVIQGGNHSQFGSYGLQKKDNQPKISSEKQLEESVKEILNIQ